MFMAIRQRGHNPVGELGGNGVPHCGQTGVEPVLIPDTYRSPPVCYTTKRILRNCADIVIAKNLSGSNGSQPLAKQQLCPTGSWQGGAAAPPRFAAGEETSHLSLSQNPSQIT
jgi:hypothetical protein